mmetsp:Transcript_22519/g.33776  ORF Transcript_22519/g.33776 Transcript_22519/m.33776 type:complete len:234 (-) Transcript_22519:209-910(-)
MALFSYPALKLSASTKSLAFSVGAPSPYVDMMNIARALLPLSRYSSANRNLIFSPTSFKSTTLTLKPFCLPSRSICFAKEIAVPDSEPNKTVKCPPGYVDSSRDTTLGPGEITSLTSLNDCEVSSLVSGTFDKMKTYIAANTKKAHPDPTIKTGRMAPIGSVAVEFMITPKIIFADIVSVDVNYLLAIHIGKEQFSLVYIASAASARFYPFYMLLSSKCFLLFHSPNQVLSMN